MKRKETTTTTTTTTKAAAGAKKQKPSNDEQQLQRSSSGEECDKKPSNETIPESNIGFLEKIQKRRLETCSSVAEFPFKKDRVRCLSDAKLVGESVKGIIYWMSRDARVQDNWAFLYAQRLSLKLELPLIVCYCLVPKFLNATLRHYKFLLEGLRETEEECSALNIPFRLLLGSAGEKIPEFVREHKIGAVVCDFSPLRVPSQWIEEVKKNLPPEIPLIQCDAHNIVPVWVTSDKQEYAARTIRNKITSKLSQYLTEFPPVIKHPHTYPGETFPKVDWKAAYASLKCETTVDEVDWAKAGYKAACAQLETFCNRRLRLYSSKRNDPTMNALSNLSPWFHFGHISVQRCVLEVSRLKSKFKESVEAFCEEAVVRRELSDNFCFYNANYDNLEGLHAWALKTLNDHRKDKRNPCYTLKEFEEARTHEDLWNAAQLQLKQEGKLHGFLRMYWAKKILEWSESPEKALEIAIYLNDKYSLDGRDPNGYVGCMWSIGGVHDQGWSERAIFGKIRYMNYQGCKRKFDVAAFVARYARKKN